MLDLTKLTTEQRNPKTMELDSFTPLEIATVMNEENNNVIKAIDEVLPQVARAIEWAGESLNAGGRITTWAPERPAAWACSTPWSARPRLASPMTRSWDSSPAARAHS